MSHRDDDTGFDGRYYEGADEWALLVCRGCGHAAEHLRCLEKRGGLEKRGCELPNLTTLEDL